MLENQFHGLRLNIDGRIPTLKEKQKILKSIKRQVKNSVAEPLSLKLLNKKIQIKIYTTPIALPAFYFKETNTLYIRSDQLDSPVFRHEVMHVAAQACFGWSHPFDLPASQRLLAQAISEARKVSTTLQKASREEITEYASFIDSLPTIQIASWNTSLTPKLPKGSVFSQEQLYSLGLGQELRSISRNPNLRFKVTAMNGPIIGGAQIELDWKWLETAGEQIGKILLRDLEYTVAVVTGGLEEEKSLYPKSGQIFDMAIVLPGHPEYRGRYKLTHSKTDITNPRKFIQIYLQPYFIKESPENALSKVQIFGWALGNILHSLDTFYNVETRGDIRIPVFGQKLDISYDEFLGMMQEIITPQIMHKFFPLLEQFMHEMIDTCTERTEKADNNYLCEPGDGYWCKTSLDRYSLTPSDSCTRKPASKKIVDSGSDNQFSVEGTSAEKIADSDLDNQSFVAATSAASRPEPALFMPMAVLWRAARTGIAGIESLVTAIPAQFSSIATATPSFQMPVEEIAGAPSSQAPIIIELPPSPNTTVPSPMNELDLSASDETTLVNLRSDDQYVLQEGIKFPIETSVQEITGSAGNNVLISDTPHKLDVTPSNGNNVLVMNHGGTAVLGSGKDHVFVGEGTYVIEKFSPASDTLHIMQTVPALKNNASDFCSNAEGNSGPVAKIAVADTAIELPGTTCAELKDSIKVNEDPAGFTEILTQTLSTSTATNPMATLAGYAAASLLACNEEIIQAAANCIGGAKAKETVAKIQELPGSKILGKVTNFAFHTTAGSDTAFVHNTIKQTKQSMQTENTFSTTTTPSTVSKIACILGCGAANAAQMVVEGFALASATHVVESTMRGYQEDGVSGACKSAEKAIVDVIPAGDVVRSTQAHALNESHEHDATTTPVRKTWGTVLKETAKTYETGGVSAALEKLATGFASTAPLAGSLFDSLQQLDGEKTATKIEMDKTSKLIPTATPPQFSGNMGLFGLRQRRKPAQVTSPDSLRQTPNLPASRKHPHT